MGTLSRNLTRRSLGNEARAGADRFRRHLAGLTVLRHPLVKLLAGAVLILGLLAVGYRLGTGLQLGSQGGTVSASDAEECARRGCDIHFTATLASRPYAEQLGLWQDIAPRLKTAQALVLSATAHAGTVRQLSLEGKVFLSVGGIRYPAAQQTLQVSSHHNTYLVFFPRYDMQGRPLLEGQTAQAAQQQDHELHPAAGHSQEGETHSHEGDQPSAFDIIIQDVGDGLPQHTIRFRSPLPTAERSRPSFPQMLMVIGAAMGALLLTCTPCLVGSLTVGSVTTGTTAGFSAKAALGNLRTTAARTTLAYLAALVVVYLGIAVAFYAFQLQIEALRPLEVVSGLVLLGIGLSLLRSTRLGACLESRLAQAILKIAPGFRQYVAQEQPGVSLGQGSSSAMGASLAMVCSVAGAPTLSTATLLPLLVYAGISSPFWAFLILLAYLVVCALPFFLVTVGLGELLLTASWRLRSALLTANGLLLIGLGLVLVVSPSTVAGVVSTPVRLMLVPLGWLL